MKPCLKPTTVYKKCVNTCLKCDPYMPKGRQCKIMAMTQKGDNAKLSNPPTYQPTCLKSGHTCLKSGHTCLKSGPTIPYHTWARARWGATS